MINLLKKIYNKISVIPMTLLIVSGIYEMLLGDFQREFLSGHIQWNVPITQTMIIDATIAIIVVYIFFNGLPKSYVKLMNNSKTKRLSTVILIATVVIMIVAFVSGRLFLKKTVFYLNFLLFIAILLIICILQKTIESFVTKKANSVVEAKAQESK